MIHQWKVLMVTDLSIFPADVSKPVKVYSWDCEMAWNNSHIGQWTVVNRGKGVKLPFPPFMSVDAIGRGGQF